MFEKGESAARNELLLSFKSLGNANVMIQKIFNMIGQSKFFEDFTVNDVEKLTSFMHAYEVEAGTTIIREGDIDDYMLFIIEGRVNILKTDSNGERRPMTIAGPGTTLGEMSMIDGEPRFASCIALDATTFAVLSRESMVEIIMEEPSFGSKILIKLITMLSQRLRSTSSELVHYLEHSQTQAI
ncbi:MAG: cyclic nucleotide-binding protein [SAR86 cluster bacterium]|uniref:Cyclic nucleotide-binding protein n=1 Tax=SAR86 cluster bacterium TaxID=2030880 RepID=A0A2A5CBH4_9GAMM|nr:MAG: cyclic nucleotide-binding protein [SAR86 cluster bacterium]